LKKGSIAETSLLKRSLRAIRGKKRRSEGRKLFLGKSEGDLAFVENGDAGSYQEGKISARERGSIDFRDALSSGIGLGGKALLFERKR